MRSLLALLLFTVVLSGCAAPTQPAPNPSTPTPAPVIETQAPTSVPATVPPTSTDVPVPANASQMPDPSGYDWVLFATGLDRPVDIQHAGDGSGRVFIIEQPGRIRTVEKGLLLPQPFLDITDRVGSEGSEQGLLGLAFHPNYKENGLFFVNYTNKRGNTVISQFTVTPDPNQADGESEKILLRIDQPFSNHNGGPVAFGPDGYLYIGLGDGGAAGDPLGNAQSRISLLGKILRIDVDGGDPYAIPADNPPAGFFERPEIWASGLRNPWKLSFDRATGDLYIGDVGQGEWEEINHVPSGIPSGLNFGWDYFEGTYPYEGQNDKLVFTPPVAEYSHAEGCSVTGGVVYRGTDLSEWNGVYLYGDFCTGRLWGLLQTGNGWQARVQYETGFAISTFGADEQGEVYVSNYGEGAVYKLVRK